jgi:hypothetical protein
MFKVKIDHIRLQIISESISWRVKGQELKEYVKETER